MAQAATQRLTIRQIADLAGVSIATVSRVLNGRGDVSDETREAVSRVIRENGYTANRSARGLSAGRTGLVGVLVPLVYPAYFSAILAGAAEALSERDLQIVLSPTGHEHDREVSVLDRLCTALTDGALIILPEESSEELERLLDGGYRFVVVDPLHAARRAHPLGLGRAHVGRRPGDATPARRSGTGGSRRSPGRPAGWRPRIAAAATAARSPPRGSCPIRRSRSRPSPRSAAARALRPHLLGLPEPPTAIFAFNDNIAIGAIQAARARGLRVPEDVSIVGFDDVEHATIVTPALTTVRQPLAEMGRTAVSLLEPAARAAALRDAPRRARDAARRARLDRAAARPRNRQPPAIAPTTLNGCAPEATSSGSGSSAESSVMSCPQAKKRMKSRRFAVP